jgi:hypothetical protein
VFLPAEQEGKRASSAHIPRTLPLHSARCLLFQQQWCACSVDGSAGRPLAQGCAVQGAKQPASSDMQSGTVSGPVDCRKKCRKTTHHRGRSSQEQSSTRLGSAGNTTLTHLATCAIVAMIHTASQCQLSKTTQHSRHANCAGPQKPDTAKTQRLRPLLGVSQPPMRT